MTESETTGLRTLDFDDPAGGLLAYTIDGKITAEQAQPIFQRIEDAADEGRALRLYYELEGFPSAEASVFLEKLEHMRSIFKAVERLAIVGDQRWLELYVKVFDPITKVQLRHFSGRDAALAWLRE
jgi:hypothetical protein